MYQSPTDMGVNRASSGIVNDSIITEASHQEIIRRYFRCAVEYAMGLADKDTLDQAVKIMNKAGAKAKTGKWCCLQGRLQRKLKNAEKAMRESLAEPQLNCMTEQSLPAKTHP